jgi:hypothetical protein
MPTGYTAGIIEGIDFKTYAMNCARAFGACVGLRDSPGGGEHIPDAFESSDYHRKKTDKALCELAVLESMTQDELERTATREWEDSETNRLMHLEKKRKQCEAYEAMLEKVKAWVPPTQDHAGLHTFMRTQIEQSIEFDCRDCRGDYYITPTVRLTGKVWKRERRAELMRNVEYHRREYAAEVERAAKRTAWIRDLRSSL